MKNHHFPLVFLWFSPEMPHSIRVRGWDQQWCSVARQAARMHAAGREPHFDQVEGLSSGLSDLGSLEGVY